ncbi:isopentenyl phosphate kinase [Halorubrum vacuolatum]|uniref:Isopentenyl phosphate kinase n=1 Tax=Halorubrum vacuolatum TaxID=63740 RepID=A0A238X1N0_HALVU|nr:isopentenyl phosphate kinase [Halorubrum vacuolatum]SNR52875.1 isopentenyl phosphate kinase [Halorubrum vacuolatum]
MSEDATEDCPNGSDDVVVGSDDVVVVKLGGSLITEKDRPETIDENALEAACDTIGAALADGAVAPDRLVLVHGGGSFGHHHASKHGVSTTAGTHDAAAAFEIHGAMARLNHAIVTRLHDRSVPAVPVHPLSTSSRPSGVDRDLDLPTASMATLLAEGFVPVIHGDGVATRGAGITVVSGDELVVEIAERFGADRVGLCSTVPGVLDDEGVIVPEITSFEAVAEYLGGSDATDVSGGMAGKVRELLALSSQAFVFGPDGLDGFLRGDEPGTRIG